MFLLFITDFHLKSVGTQAANLDLSLNELNSKFSRLSTVAASRRGAWERSENVRSIFINILPPHLAPVTWLSVSGSCGVRSELINAISSPAPCATLVPRAPLTWRRMRVLAVIEDAVTVLEVGMNHFPPRINSPFTGVHSPLKHLAWIMGSCGELLSVSVGCRAKGTAGRSAWPSSCVTGGVNRRRGAPTFSVFTGKLWLVPVEWA